MANIEITEFARQIAENKDHTYYVSLTLRIGFNALTAVVEGTMFHSVAGPLSNDDFEVYTMEWEGVPFSAFRVPADCEAEVSRLTDILLMQLVKGSPGMVTAKGIRIFPGTDEAARGRHNLYTVENSAGSQVYLNRADLDRALYRREGEIVEAMMTYGPQVPPEWVRDYLWFGMLEEFETPVSTKNKI